MKLNSCLKCRPILMTILLLWFTDARGQNPILIQQACQTCTQHNLAVTSDKNSICAGEQVTLSLQAPMAPPALVSTQWSNGETMVGSITVRPKVTTTYYVTYQFPDNCEETSSIKVTVNPSLNLNRKTVIKTPVGTDSLWCKSWVDSMTMIKMNPDSLPSGSYTYTWSDGSNADSLVIKPDTSMSYNTYYVNIMKGDSCYRDSIKIKIIDCPCGGDPIINPVIADTWIGSTQTYSTQKSLFGCYRNGSTACPQNCAIGDTTKRPHYALDIGSNIHLDSFVHSMYNGVIHDAYTACDPNECNTTSTTCNSSAGNYVDVKSLVNSDTVFFRYAHLNVSYFNKNNKGDTIKQGQVLGLMGRSGNLACDTNNITHTHIIAFLNGSISNCNRENPLDYFASSFNDTTYTWTYLNCN